MKILGFIMLVIAIGFYGALLFFEYKKYLYSKMIKKATEKDAKEARKSSTAYLNGIVKGGM